uniref:Uncharacterized protein n=1 Tax=Panagrolaimus sp. PS1159 TaxID=55785 RepID=A0AC35F3E0_9BILA
MKIKRVFLSTEDVKDKFPEQSPPPPFTTTTTAAAVNNNIEFEDEDEDEKKRNRNQLLKKMDAFNELIIQNKSMKEQLFASNELSEERRKLISIKDKEIKELQEKLKIKTEETQQKDKTSAPDELSEKRRKLLLVKDEIIKQMTAENEHLGISLSLKNEHIEKMGTELEQLTEENKLLKLKLETKMEESQGFENVLSNKIEKEKRKDDKIEDLENQLLAEKKRKAPKRIRKRLILLPKENAKRKAPKRIRKRLILIPKENAACKNCQQSNVQQKNEEKETELIQKSFDSNIENAMVTPSRSKPIPLPRSARVKLMSSPSQLILAEAVDDLPSPSTASTPKILDQTYSISKFSTSTPILPKSLTVFESNVKMPPLSPILKSRQATPESPLARFNKSFSSTNPSHSNVTPKRTLPNIRQIFSRESQKKSMNFNILKESNQPRINEFKIDGTVKSNQPRINEIKIGGTVSLNELLDNILFPGKMNDNNNDEKENVGNSGD